MSNTVRLVDIVRSALNTMRLGDSLAHTQDDVTYSILKEYEGYSYWENGACIDKDMTLSQAIEAFVEGY